MKNSKSLLKVLKFGTGVSAILALTLVSVWRWKKVDNRENSSKRTACMRNHPSGKDKN